MPCHLWRKGDRGGYLKVAIIAPSCFAVNPNLDYGGTEVCVLNLCEELRAYCDVTLIAPKGSYLDGVSVIETVEPKRAWGQDEAAYEIYKDRLGQFDVIHSNEHQMLTYRYKREHPEAKLCHTLHGIQTLPTLHPVPEPNLITLSQFHRQDCQSRYGAEYRVIPHGIDLDRYSFIAEKEDYLLHFGLIAPHKGHDTTFDLMQRTGARVVIAGEDRFVPDINYVSAVRDDCRRLGAEYLGPVNLSQKVRLMQKAKAVLLPFHIGEAFSLIAIEALGCGTPVITSNVGGMPEIITNGYDGFLCNNGDDFVRAVGNIDSIKPSDCRAKAEVQFSRSLMANRHFRLYQEIGG